jgi:hypothetical protein
MSRFLTRSLLASAMLLASGIASADTRVIREHQFRLDDIDTLEIHASVGSIDIVPANGDVLEVVLRMEGKHEGWFSGTRDVEEVDLEQRQRNGKLRLEQTAEDTETHWQVRLPQLANTSVHLGVGEIRAELPATQLEIQLGVGEVDVEYPRTAAGDMQLKVGVGDASIHGGANVDARRAFVSQDISASGRGERDIDINVGVGSAALQLL